MDPYAVLGVSRDAHRTEIRKAYLALARRFHPDQLGDRPAATQLRAEARMREINAAWAVLGDVRQRAAFDAGRAADEPPGRPAVVRPRPAGTGWRPRADDTDWMDDFETWKYATDHLLDVDDDHAEPRPLLVVLPILMALASVALGILGLALNVRPLIAGAVGGLVCSVAVFFVLPILVMTAQRGQRSRRL